MGQLEVWVWHLGKRNKLEKQVMQFQRIDDSNGHVRSMFPIKSVQSNKRRLPRTEPKEKEPSGERKN